MALSVVDHTGSTIGGGAYKLQKRIGGGDYGDVYRAVQLGTGRIVAVKVLRNRANQDLRWHQRRLWAEHDTLSLVDHNDAIRVIDARVDPDGTMWIAMPLIRGITLREWLELHGPMSLVQLVPLMTRIVAAVAAAHKEGIVHRDLKPENIMVQETKEGELVPTVLDFGIAKWIGSDRDLVIGSSEGAFGYRAPEWWDDQQDAGPASDVYALGILAFELLTGKRPFDAVSREECAQLHRTAMLPELGLGSAVYLAIARAAAKTPGARPPPDAFAQELAEALKSDPLDHMKKQAQDWDRHGRAKDRLLRGGALVEMKRTAQRTPAALTARDRSFLSSSTRWQRMRLALAAFAASAALAFVAYHEVNKSQQEARAAEQQVTAIEAEQGRAALITGDNARALEHLWEAYRRGDHSPTIRFMLDRALGPRLALQGRLPATSERMWSSSFSPDGKRILTSDDKNAQVWDAQSKTRLALLPHGDIVYEAIFSADGHRIATACEDGRVRVWDASTGSRLHELQAGGMHQRYRRVAFSPDGRFIAAMDALGRVADVWDVITGGVVAEIVNDAHESASLAFSPDGRWLATGGGDDVRVVDTGTWTRTLTITGPKIISLAWDPTAPRLLTGSESGDASIWDIPSGKRVRHLCEVGEAITATAFSRDGELVVTASRDGNQLVWIASSGKLQSRTELGRGRVLSVEFSSSGDRVLTSSMTGAIIVSDAMQGLRSTVLEGPASPAPVARFDPASHLIVSSSFAGAALLWDASDPYRSRSPKGASAFPAPSPIVATHAEIGRRVTLPSTSGAPVLWDGDRPIATLTGHVGKVWSWHFVGDGQILTSGADGTVRLWSATGEQIRIFRGVGSHHIADAALSPDRALVVGGGGGGLLQIWDAHSGQELWTLRVHADPVARVAYQDGDIVTQSLSGEVGRWSLPPPGRAIDACAASTACGIVAP